MRPSYDHLGNHRSDGNEDGLDKLVKLDLERRNKAKKARESRTSFLALFTMHGTILPALIRSPLLWFGFLIYAVVRTITAVDSIPGRCVYAAQLSYGGQVERISKRYLLRQDRYTRKMPQWFRCRCAGCS